VGKLAQLGQGTRKSIIIPKLSRLATMRASAPSFVELTHGQLTADARSYYPFENPADKTKYGRYGLDSQAAIAASLRAGIQGKQSTGTAPELVVIGYYLLLGGWRLGFNLLFQSQGFDVFHRYRPFTVDIAVTQAGLMYFFPVDGVRFHAATLMEIVRDMQRDQRLRQQGQIVPVPDTECQNLVRLQAWLRGKGAPA